MFQFHSPHQAPHFFDNIRIYLKISYAKHNKKRQSRKSKKLAQIVSKEKTAIKRIITVPVAVFIFASVKLGIVP